MKLFVQSSTCTSGAHCRACRDRDGGRTWRERLGRAFALPAGAPDFICPHGRPWGWTGKAPLRAERRVSGPGDVVKAVLDRLGYQGASGCSCEEMRQRMNAWGWWGCWRRRDEIVAWFTAKANDQGIVVERATILGLLRAAWRNRR
jgi:hypothetical protein